MPRTPIWLWIITLVLLAVLVFFQRPEVEDPKDAAQAAAGMNDIKPPKASEFVLVGKFLIAVKDLVPKPTGSAAPGLPNEDPATMLVQMSDQFAGWVGKDRIKPASVDNPPEPPKEGHDPEAAADRLRAAIIAGEALPKSEVAWRVLDVERTLDPKSPLVEDVETVRTLYGIPKPVHLEYSETTKSAADTLKQVADEVKVRPDPSGTMEIDAAPAEGHDAAAQLTQAQKDGFKSRHGWFADLAMSHGDPNSKLRSEAASQGVLVLVVLGLVGALVFFAGIGGFALLITFAVRLIGGNWKWSFRRPVVASEWPLEPAPSEFPRSVALATPGSVWLETVAVFFAGFLGIKVLGMGLHAGGVGKETLIAFSLGAQWLLALTIFWPMARGMSWTRWKEDIGWRAPRGVLREVGAGFLGYCAGLPVYFFMAAVVVVITLIINAITGGDTKPQGNKILDLLEGGGIWELILIYLLATVWAPVVEESIFRGCLFRHLRRRLGLLLAALGSAMVFAALHGYVLQGLIMVGTLGFWFALIREWRGNIIATATAHAIHNGVVTAVLLIVLSLASA